MFLEIDQSIVHRYFSLFQHRSITACALVFSFFSFSLTVLALYSALFIQALLAGDISDPVTLLVFTSPAEEPIENIFAIFYLKVLIIPLVETLLFQVLLFLFLLKISRNILISVIMSALAFSYFHLGNDVFVSFHTLLTGIFYAYGFYYWKEVRGSMNAGIQFTYLAHAFHNLWSNLLDFIKLPWVY